LVLLLLVALPGGGIALGVGGDLQQAWGRGLQLYYGQAVGWVAVHPWAALLVFAGLYFVGVTFSLPGAVWMSLLAGALFGPWKGAALVVVAATGGATAIFMLARFGLAEAQLARALTHGGALRQRLQDQAFWVLLGMRLMPVCPFWLVNLLSAAVGMRLWVYVSATFIGIIPGAVLYTATGSGLGVVLERGEAPDLGLIWHPEVLLPMVGLAVLALLPVIGPPLLRASRRLGKKGGGRND
jgi:uncharacterized membrane protein YdjX (TVP38/TMEM64 family)